MSEQQTVKIPIPVEVTPGPKPEDLMTVGEFKALMSKYPDNCSVLVQSMEDLRVIPVCDLSYGILEVDENGNEKFEKSIVSILVGEEAFDESGSESGSGSYESEEEPEPEPPKPKARARPKKSADSGPAPAKASKATRAPAKPRAVKKTEKPEVLTPAPSNIPGQQIILG